MSNNDDWDSWENTPNTAETQQDSWNNSSDDWGSSDVSQQDDWDSSGNSDWNNTSNQNNFADFSEQSQEDYWEQQDNFIQDSHVSERPPKQFNFGLKTIGIIIAGLFLLVALILLILSNVKVKPKQNNNSTVGNTTQATSQIETENSTTAPSNSNSNNVVSMIEIPTSTKLNYNGEVFESNAQVVKKIKYLEGHQVIYCIVLKIVAGSSSEEVKYYCNYSSFGAVSVGDLVFVKYQQPQDGYISINEISK